jgi:hypothetical protein
MIMVLAKRTSRNEVAPCLIFVAPAKPRGGLTLIYELDQPEFTVLILVSAADVIVATVMWFVFGALLRQVLDGPVLRSAFGANYPNDIGGLVDPKASDDKRDSGKSAKALILQYDRGERRQHRSCRHNCPP